MEPGKRHALRAHMPEAATDWLNPLSLGTMAVFTPQLWDRNGSGTQPGARVHTCSTASGRSGTSRPPRDVIAVEPFWNRSGTGPVGSVV